MSLYLISNMYPSERNIRYGIFVKRFEEAIQAEFDIKKIVLTKKTGVLPKLFGYIVLFLRLTRLYFIVGKKDLVYVHFPLYFGLVLYPFIWKKVPLVLNFHGSDAVFDSMIKRILFVLLAPVVRKCQKVVVPSAHYKIRIGTIFQIEKSKIFVYPSGGINKQMFYPIKRYKSIFTVGFVSNFIEQKGWSVFLEALHHLNTSKKISQYRALMVGDGPHKKLIQEEIKKKNLNVDIVDSVEQHELVAIYNSFDVFVFPTFRESLGLVGLEAMMCGVPVIASAVEGPMGYVKNGYNGLLFEKGRSKELAQKLIEYHSLSTSEIDRMKNNCLVTAMAYETENINSALIKVLNSL